MFKLIKTLISTFFSRIHRLIHPKSADVSPSDPADSINSTNNEDEDRENDSADTDASLATDRTVDAVTIDSTDTGESESDSAGSDDEFIEDDEQGTTPGHDKQEDASTETETDSDTSTPSVTDQTDDTEAIDSADTGGSEDDDFGSDEESIEDEEQDVPPGHEKREDASTEGETDPDTSTPSGTDQTENMEAMDSTDAEESEENNTSSDDESKEDKIQGTPPEHDKQDNTPTETETDALDETRPKGSDSTSNDAPNASSDTTSGEKRRRRPKSPGERGSRRDQSKRAAKAGNNSVVTPTFTPRPELICRKLRGSPQWEIILSVPEECNIVEVRHNNSPLSHENGEYRLSSFSGHLSAQYADTGKNVVFPLFDGKTPLFFKFQQKWRGNGHNIKRVTYGHFIIIAPRESKRMGKGWALEESEECTDAEFRAHAFFRDKADTGDNAAGFEDFGTMLADAGCQLLGNRVFDDSDHGELFVGKPPELIPAPGIAWMRVGEEKRSGWHGENFRCAEKSLGDVLNGREGRFFLRAYDNEIILVDSIEFRYCSALHEIRMDGKPYSPDLLIAPSSTGHSPTKLQFVNRDGAPIHLIKQKDNSQDKLVSNDIVTVPPDPDCDRVARVLNSGAYRVNIEIELPRIWWSLCKSKHELGPWRDKALNMTRDEFRELADENAVIQLRLPSRIQRVKSGFERNLNRTFRVSDGIVIAAFEDYDEIENPSTKNTSLRVQCDEKTVITLIRFSANLPSINLPVPCGKGVFAYVKRAGGGWRYAKGFSRGELRDAGLTTIDAVRLRIRVDKRRRSTHKTNLNALKQVNNYARTARHRTLDTDDTQSLRKLP